MATTKTYLDLDTLKYYDGKIKTWTDDEIDGKIDALDVTEAPIAEENSTTHVITIHGIKEADGKVAVGNTAANDVILAPVAATGDADDVVYGATTVALTLDMLTGSVLTPGSVANSVKAGIDALDVSEINLASVSSNVVNIKGIKEVDGKIVIGDGTGIDLEEVAYTGAAADVSIVDAAGNFTSSDVEGALAELADAAGGGIATKTVYITETAGGSGDAYSKRYGIYQGADGSTSSPDPTEHLVDIDIPKDMVVEDGKVVEVTFVEGTGGASDMLTAPIGTGGADVDVTEEIKGTGVAPTAADAGQYILLTIANAASSHLWIKASDLVDIYTSGSVATDEIVVTVNNTTNQITAAIGTNGIPASKVIHDVAAVYTQLTSDDTYSSSETYYTKSGATYTEDTTVTAANFADKVAAGLYILTSAATTETVQVALDNLVNNAPEVPITTSEIDDLFS